jgi:2-polyprenyl-6-methoxyphenol hydroxylase-like FAD-dependent oxidoreductase
MTQEQTLRAALGRAYSLGQIYWQQADSESYLQNKKADATDAKFKQLVEESVAALALLPQAQEQTDARTCTCHPDDNPPQPCPRKFSLSECRAALASTPKAAQQEGDGVALPVSSVAEPASFRLEWGGRVVAWGDALDYGKACFEAGRAGGVPGTDGGKQK